MRNRSATFLALLMRDGSACYLCGQEPDGDDPLEIEHVKPREAKGGDDMENLRLAHRSCNRTKGIHSVTNGKKEPA